MKAYYNENKFYNHLEEWVGAVLLAGIRCMDFRIFTLYVYVLCIPGMQRGLPQK